MKVKLKTQHIDQLGLLSHLYNAIILMKDQDRSDNIITLLDGHSAERAKNFISLGFLMVSFYVHDSFTCFVRLTMLKVR